MADEESPSSMFRREPSKASDYIFARKMAEEREEMMRRAQASMDRMAAEKARPAAQAAAKAAAEERMAARVAARAEKAARKPAAVPKVTKKQMLADLEAKGWTFKDVTVTRKAIEIVDEIDVVYTPFYDRETGTLIRNKKRLFLEPNKKRGWVLAASPTRERLSDEGYNVSSVLKVMDKRNMLVEPPVAREGDTNEFGTLQVWSQLVADDDLAKPTILVYGDNPDDSAFDPDDDGRYYTGNVRR